MILRSPGLCRLYWAVDSDGQYLHTVKALTEQFGLGAGQVNQLVRNSSQAFSVDRQCPRCEKGFLVQSRTELTQSQRWPVSNYKECQVELAAIRERKTKELEGSAAIDYSIHLSIYRGKPNQRRRSRSSISNDTWFVDPRWRVSRERDNSSADCTFPATCSNS
jgi:hypothetical protein